MACELTSAAAAMHTVAVMRAVVGGSAVSSRPTICEACTPPYAASGARRPGLAQADRRRELLLAPGEEGEHRGRRLLGGEGHGEQRHAHAGRLAPAREAVHPRGDLGALAVALGGAPAHARADQPRRVAHAREDPLLLLGRRRRRRRHAARGDRSRVAAVGREREPLHVELARAHAGLQPAHLVLERARRAPAAQELAMLVIAHGPRW
jgi:hypothetical protein